MALLLAVTIISLLVAVTVEFNKNMRQELVGSVTVKENSQFGAMMRSGYNLAEAVLLQDGKDNDFDSEHDRWAKLGDSNFSKLFGRGNLELIAIDLAGKLQLNSLGVVSQQQGGSAGSVADAGREILTRMLESGDFGDLATEEVSLIVDAITDWVDIDDKEKGIEETESSYYQSLEPSYSCKNGPFEYIEELLLVRGITRDLYFGTGELKGLRDFVTVYGDDGKININSAAPEILLAMNADMTEELAQKMIVFREDESNKTLLQEGTWYNVVPSWPGDVQFDTEIVTTVSRFFGITATATYNEMKRTLYAVVLRESDDKIGMVSRKVE